MADVPAEDLPSSSKWVNDNFILGDLLGSGTFGKVYTVQCRRNRGLYALKEISQSSHPKYIAREVRVMTMYGGRFNIMNLHAAYRDKGRVFVVMDHFPHDSFKDVLPIMAVEEKLEYFKNLLIALEYLHMHKIIHRDVKPANFLYNRRNQRFALIDFGLSHEYDPASAEIVETQKRRNVLGTSNVIPRHRRLACGCNEGWICETCMKKPTKHVNKAGTPGFRAPEVLLRFDQTAQTTALDIWSAGVVLLSLLFKRHPIFRPTDDFDAICEVCAVIGTESVVRAAAKAGVNARLPPYPGFDLARLAPIVRSGWMGNLKTELNCHICHKFVHGNTKGRCFCKKSEKETLTELSPVEQLLIRLTRYCLEPDPTRRKSARTLLMFIEELEVS